MPCAVMTAVNKQFLNIQTQAKKFLNPTDIAMCNQSFTQSKFISIFPIK